jgi:hypothetical protein
MFTEIASNVTDSELGALALAHHPRSPCGDFLGTYFGGWRIVHTMGSKITKLKPFGGFCAETAGAITLFATALAGIPVSTTHTITGGHRRCW